MSKTKQQIEMAKILKDLIEQRNESKRMMENPSLIWKFRGLVSKVEYWIISLSFLISIVIWLVTGDFYKAIIFYLASVVYAVSANIRGLTLHLENLVEWLMRKRV